MKISHNNKDILFQFNNGEVMIRNVPKRKERNVTPKEENIMKPEDRVMTPIGPGTILLRESETGYLKDRYCVCLDDADKLDEMSMMTHKKYGGVYFHKSDLKKEE